MTKWILKDLCSHLSCNYQISGKDDVEVLGLQLNSNDVAQGDAFFCLIGEKSDGHNFAKSAKDNGASCLFVEHKLDNTDITQVIVDDTRSVMAQVSKVFYNDSTKEMHIIGITGTNGKTTVSNIVSHVLSFNNIHNGLVGTVGIKIDGKIADDSKFNFVGRTTPEAFQLQKMMYEFLNMGIKHVVMEVSSHAIVQNRIQGIDFEVTAFTNLSQDHLDYHKTMDDYFDAKSMLFTNQYSAKRVVCIDDAYGQKLYDNVKAAGDDVVSVSLNKEADYNLSNIRPDFNLIGKFNKQNMLVAFGICKQLGLEDENIYAAFDTMPEVEGRMQSVDTKNNDFRVFVDYCHTPDAIENVLLTLKEECKGKLITVFGCGGDRDRDKRPKMGKIAIKNSDYVIVTSDNPRSEDPEFIIDEILEGMSGFGNFKRQSDRKKAIYEAINLANSDDIVLIAGKGHEKYQEVNGKKLEFDDVLVAQEAISLKV